MNGIEISVIIPIYCVSEYIEKCATSLFNQSITEGIEFIFVNDCTPDDSIRVLKDVLSRYPERLYQVQIVSTQYNKGLAGARLLGLSHVRGEYIIHCDSDDYVDKNMYEKMLDMARKEVADIVVCDYFGVYSHKMLPYRQYVSENIDDFRHNILEGKLHNGLWNKLIHRRLYEKLDSTWTEGINMWEDVSVIDRLIYYAKKVSYIPEPLYYYNRINLGSYTNSKSLKNAIQIDNAYHIVKDFYDKVPDSEKWMSDMVKFKQRTMLTIIPCLQVDKRDKWIEDNGLRDEKLCLKVPIHRRFLYNLYIFGHHSLADSVVRLMNFVAKLIR